MTYPTIRPELTLDFANSRQLDPRITFSRSSSATYLNPDTGLITLASDHEARFEAGGLLIEESRTNHCLYSGVDPTNWAQNGTSSLAVSSVPAPDGGTCYDLTTDTGGPNSVRQQSNTSAPVGTSVLSVFARFPNAGFTSLAIRNFSAGGGANYYADYRPATDSWHGEVACTGLPSEDLGNGWKRLTVVSTVTSSNGNNWVNIGGGANSPAFTQQTCQIWGAQLEEGGFQSSYIPTSGSSVTRSQDIARITGDNFSSWYNTSEGTMFVSMSDGVRSALGANLYGSHSADRIIMLGSSNFRFRYQATGRYTSNWTSVNIYSANDVRTAGPMKYAYAYKPYDYAFSVKGSTLTDTLRDPQPNVITLKLGEESAFSGSGRCGCAISRIAFYSRRLSDSELQTITL